MAKVSSQAKALKTLPLEALVQEALSSNDGLRIADIVKQIEITDAPAEFVQCALRDIAQAHPEMGPIVIGCLSALDRMRSSELRPLCRLIVNAPFDSDRDLVVGFAASLLANQPNPEMVDILLLAKAVDHRSEHVKLCARQAVSALAQPLADALLSGIAALPEKPQLLVLKRFASGTTSLCQLVLPSPPQRAREHQPAPKAPLQALKPPKGKVRIAPPTPAIIAEQPSPLPAAPPTAEAQYPQNSTAQSPPPPAPEEAPDLASLLQPHRIRGFHLLSESALANTIILSKNYREVAAALAEITVRHGVERALLYNGRLVYALSDDTNVEKHRFCEIAKAWFRFS